MTCRPRKKSSLCRSSRNYESSRRALATNVRLGSNIAFPDRCRECPLFPRPVVPHAESGYRQPFDRNADHSCRSGRPSDESVHQYASFPRRLDCSNCAVVIAHEGFRRNAQYPRPSRRLPESCRKCNIGNAYDQLNANTAQNIARSMVIPARRPPMNINGTARSSPR